MNKIRVYLDNCCFNRPYDNQDKLSIKLETIAKIRIQEMIKTGDIDLIWSFMLDYENSGNTWEIKRNSIYEWFNNSIMHVSVSEEIIQHSEFIHTFGFGEKDSIHLSCAIFGRSDYFITVDRGILNRKNKVADLVIIDPVEFIRITEEKNEK